MPRRHSNQKHTPYQHKAPCARKRGFKTEEDALLALADSLGMVQLKTYQCPYCAKWHLSSKEK